MNYKRIFSVTIVLCLAVYAFLQWQNQPQIKNVNSTGTSVIAFGDSLVYGVGASQIGETDMFSIVSKEADIPIINKGVPGNTTNDALARIDQDVLSQDPRIVFVLFGGNDYLQKIPKETTFQNLSIIIEKIESQGAAVILIGVRGGIFVDRFEEDYKLLAEKYKTGYVPNILEGLITNRNFMYDSIHPNDKGYRIVATRITPVLQQILEK